MSGSGAALNENEEMATALQLASGAVLPMTLRAAVELDLFEILAGAGGCPLSASEIASRLTALNPDASIMLERMLSFLASSSILNCSVVDSKKVYSLAPISKYFVRNQDGVSLAPLLLLLQDKVIIDSWYHVKDAILKGGIPFDKAHGTHAFEYPSKDSRFNELFNNGMKNTTGIILQKLLQVYKGFEGLRELVDVGGGSGATVAALVSKYPHIKCINYDLPHVIKDAPPCLGVEHVGGNMFESIPKGEVIFMKHILHDWGDRQCSQLLRNCWNALPPKSGKLIVVDCLLPEHPETDVQSRGIFCSDVIMLTMNPGGKERTKAEFDALATEAGFAASQVICQVHGLWVLEFHKIQV